MEGKTWSLEAAGEGLAVGCPALFTKLLGDLGGGGSFFSAPLCPQGRSGGLVHPFNSKILAQSRR